MSDDIDEYLKHLDEYRIQVSADGINLSAPWRLADYGYVGPLTDAQVAELAERFEINALHLRRLSFALGRVLNPAITPYQVPISRSRAAERGKKEVEEALRHIGCARQHLAAALSHLTQIYVDPAEKGQSAEQLEQTCAHLTNSLDLLSDVPADLEHHLGKTDAVLVLEPTDKRVIKDGRRGMVVLQIAILWMHLGRTFTCTTDIETSERRGPFIDFVNAVVPCITDPPDTLPAETIHKEIKPFRSPEWKRSASIFFRLDDRDT